MAVNIVDLSDGPFGLEVSYANSSVYSYILHFSIEILSVYINGHVTITQALPSLRPDYHV